MTATVPSSTYLLRDVTAVHRDGHGVRLDVRALRCEQLPATPGWLTGEALADQGIETTMPNLPDLQLPPLDERGYVVQVHVVAEDTVRITAAPPGSRVLSEPATWLGIVTTDAPTGRGGPPGAGDPPGLDIHDSGTEVRVRTGAIEVAVAKRPFALTVRDGSGRTVARTAHRLRQVAGFPTAPSLLVGDEAITAHLELSPDEEVLGFGEQFGRVTKNGQRLVLRVEDALGTGTGMAYKPVPVWHSSTGYTGFLNTGAVVTADVGATRPNVLQVDVDDEALDLYLVAGPSIAERLTSYTALTGRAPVPPLWAFGYWMGRCRYHSREEVEQVARGMRSHQVPCDVLHLDPDWLVLDRLNTDFVWNTDRFGERKDLVTALEDHQLRLSVWELPYLDPASPRYAEAEAAGYLARTADGSVAILTGTPTPDGRARGLLDFTNAAARAWWQGMHQGFLDDGVAVFKTDFGEGLPDGTAPADGTPGNHAHNLYPLRYNGAVSEAIAHGTGRNPLVWGRSGWAGSQRYPGQWAGDAESTVAGMHSTLRGGLSYALSAPGFWSHDIGGFFGPELTPGLYVRWTQFGAMSPLMRAHGLRPREPWHFGDRALGIARDWVRLRYQLLPHLWQVAHESAVHGWPVLRPLALVFPDDPAAWSVETSFCLGSDLLVVPVLDDGEEPVHRRFYVPEGGWTDLVTEERFTGPGHVEVVVPWERMPVLVRDGALVPRVEVDAGVRRSDDLLGRPWTLHLYGDADTVRDVVGFDGTPTEITVRDRTAASRGTQPITSTVVRHGR